jgi:hypothetical protein
MGIFNKNRVVCVKTEIVTVRMIEQKTMILWAFEGKSIKNNTVVFPYRRMKNKIRRTVFVCIDS